MIDTIIAKLDNAIDWVLAPTTISFLQDGEGTMSRLSLAFCVFVLVGIVLVMSVPKLRKEFF